jgi:predicted molibdopterin-dependent oxidoreductase YjgC
MEEFAGLIRDAATGVLVWSMGVTQHASGGDTVQMIVDLGLLRGWVGRERCGLMPIRGHSGVQGGAEMGCFSTALPGGLPVNEETARRFSDLWGFQVPVKPGLKAPEMLDAAHRGELDVLFSSGGNFLVVLPDPARVREALERTPLRIHMDIVLSSQMLADPGDAVLILPAATRYEIPGGVTETTTERRVILSPEIPGPRIEEARPEWQVLLDLAARVRPELAGALAVGGTPGLRAEIAEAVPLYAPIAGLKEGGDSFQYGGRHYPDGSNFPTDDGRAHFALVKPPAPIRTNGDGSLLLSTRRGKQFNSIVQESKDSITGATREAVMISVADAERLGVAGGKEVLLRSATGELRCRVHLAPIAPGNAQVHWPEGNVLIADEIRSPEAGIPDYNTRVTIEAA